MLSHLSVFIRLNPRQKRLDPRVFIDEFNNLTEVIPQVQHFDTYGSKEGAECSAPLFVYKLGDFFFVYGDVVVFLDKVAIFKEDDKGHGTVCQREKGIGMEVRARKNETFTEFLEECD